MDSDLVVVGMGALMNDAVHVEVEVVKDVVLIQALHDEGVAVREEAKHFGYTHGGTRVFLFWRTGGERQSAC